MDRRQTRQTRADGSTLSHLEIAGNVWDPDKKRSRPHIIFNCGRADEPAVAERLRRLARSILRRCAPEELVAENPAWGLVVSVAVRRPVCARAPVARGWASMR